MRQWYAPCATETPSLGRARYGFTEKVLHTSLRRIIINAILYTVMIKRGYEKCMGANLRREVWVRVYF